MEQPSEVLFACSDVNLNVITKTMFLLNIIKLEKAFRILSCLFCPTLSVANSFQKFSAENSAAEQKIRPLCKNSVFDSISAKYD
jgi:hypothetical protein